MASACFFAHENTVRGTSGQRCSPVGVRVGILESQTMAESAKAPEAGRRASNLSHVKALFKPYEGDKFGGNGEDTTDGLM